MWCETGANSSSFSAWTGGQWVAKKRNVLHIPSTFSVHFSFVAVTFLVFCLISDSGDPVCGFCVLRCRIQTTVHCSRSSGVCGHVAAGLVVRAQTQQEADFLLLASRCRWFAARHCNIPPVFQTLLFITVLSLSPQDAFNSVFAAVYLIVLSLMALATHTVTGTLVGGVSFLILKLPFQPPCHSNKSSKQCFHLCACAVAHQHEDLSLSTCFQIAGLLSAGLLGVDSFTLFKNITFNKPRSEAQSQDKEWMSN